MSEDLADFFNNLQIEDSDESDDIDELLNFRNMEDPKNYDCIMQNLLKILTTDETFKANIFDKVIILDDILFGINLYFLEDDVVPYKPILRIPAFNKLKISQKGDPSWWDECCSEFENSMVHLRNSSFNNLSFNIHDIFGQSDIIENEIIKLIISILNNDFNFKVDINLIQMFIISLYLENFFIKHKLESIYSEEFLYTNKYFTKFGKLVIEFLKNNDQYFSFNVSLYKKIINQSLLSVLFGARNTLILFGPYGYDALYENLEFINLNIREIFEFKQEALKYFALNNLIELKLHGKKVHVANPNEYASLICTGAKLL